jgi:cell division protein ZapE
MIRPSDPYIEGIRTGEIQPDEAQEDVVAALDVLAQMLAHKKRLFGKYEPPRGLYIHGAVGRGKSMLMDMFYEAAPVEAKRRVHFNAFMLDVHERLNQARADHHDDPLGFVAAQVAAETRLLCFDEFQVKDVADAMILSRFFTALIDDGVIVVATSNVAPNDLYQGGLQRDLFLPFISVLKARLDIVHIDDGIDYRLARLAGRQVWFNPDNSAARAEIDSLFADFSKGEWAMPEVVDVAGRALVVPLAAGRIARFTYDQLCRQPLGAADYLALADRFSVLVVDHIPRLDPANRNEVARFISLIDQLYDRHIGLVASAEVPAQALYPETGPQAAEFARTASRLAEMQSEPYFSKIK